MDTRSLPITVEASSAPSKNPLVFPTNTYNVGSSTSNNNTALKISSTPGFTQNVEKFDQLLPGTNIFVVSIIAVGFIVLIIVVVCAKVHHKPVMLGKANSSVTPQEIAVSAIKMKTTRNNGQRNDLDDIEPDEIVYQIEGKNDAEGAVNHDLDISLSKSRESLYTVCDTIGEGNTNDTNVSKREHPQSPQ